jgi:hypothetical protein
MKKDGRKAKEGRGAVERKGGEGDNVKILIE